MLAYEPAAHAAASYDVRRRRLPRPNKGAAVRAGEVAAVVVVSRQAAAATAVASVESALAEGLAAGTIAAC